MEAKICGACGIPEDNIDDEGEYVTFYGNYKMVESNVPTLSSTRTNSLTIVKNIGKLAENEKLICDRCKKILTKKCKCKDADNCNCNFVTNHINRTERRMALNRRIIEEIMYGNKELSDIYEMGRERCLEEIKHEKLCEKRRLEYKNAKKKANKKSPIKIKLIQIRRK